MQVYKYTLITAGFFQGEPPTPNMLSQNPKPTYQAFLVKFLAH